MSVYSSSNDQLSPGLALFLRWQEVSSRTMTALRAMFSPGSSASAAAFTWELLLAGADGAAPTKAVIFWAPEACWPTPILLHMSETQTLFQRQLIHDKLAQRALDLRCAIVSVDCDEQIDKWSVVAGCHSVLQWISQNADELGVDPNRIGVTGPWSTGTLAAALAVLAHDCGQANVALPNISPRSPRGVQGEDDDFVWTPSSWSPRTWPTPLTPPLAPRVRSAPRGRLAMASGQSSA